MSTTVRIKNAELNAAHHALTALGTWVRPGLLALRIGQLRHAIGAVAKAVGEQLEALVEEFVVTEGEGDEKKRKTQPGPQGEEWVLTDRTEFLKRERELLEATSEVSLQRLLTEADLEKLEKDAARADVAKTHPVDFAALLPLLEGSADVVLAPTPAAAEAVPA